MFLFVRFILFKPKQIMIHILINAVDDDSDDIIQADDDDRHNHMHMIK